MKRASPCVRSLVGGRWVASQPDLGGRLIRAAAQGSVLRVRLGVEEEGSKFVFGARESLPDHRHRLVAWRVAWSQEFTYKDALRAVRRGRRQHGMEGEHAGKSHHRNDGLHHRPDAEGVLHADVVILLEHPEPDVVEVRKHQAAGGDRQHEQLGRHARTRDGGQHDPGGGDGRHRGRTKRQAQQGGSEPAQPERRHRQCASGLLDGSRDTPVHKNLFEGAAAGDDESDHRHARYGRADAAHQRVHVSPAPQSENRHRNHRAGEKSHCGIAEEPHCPAGGSVGEPGQARQRSAEHQPHRREQADQAHAHTGGIRRHGPLRIKQHGRWRSLHGTAEPLEHGPRQQCRRRRQDQPIKQGQIRVRPEEGGNGHRRGMRRQQSMRRGQRGRKRNSQIKQRQIPRMR